MKKTLIHLILLSIGMTTSAASLDKDGCRILSPLPSPGVHPRIFFTEDEYPLIKQRIESGAFGKVFKKTLNSYKSNAKKQWADLASMDVASEEMILKHFKPSEGRNNIWGVLSLYSVVYEDQEMQDFMSRVISSYAKIIIASKELALGGDMKGKTGRALNKTINIWKTNSYDVSVSWTLGAAGMALSYDVLHNNMSEDQRSTVRKAIAIGTKGRRGYGSGMARGYAASNHYGYHGDLLVLLSSIEGEEGFDKETYTAITKVMKDYWEVGFTDNGACHEDGYGPNLGLRAGGRGLMAMARRGYNIFATQKYRNFADYVAREFEPFPGGYFMGGASGGPYVNLYQTYALQMRYMYPENPVANYVYRHTFGDKYENGLKWQGILDCFIYGTEWLGAASRQQMLAKSKLKQDVFYPVRGKLISRSDWSTDAMQFTLDARPDAFLIGHDRVDRGNFTMSAMGRTWAMAGDFRQWSDSKRHSLVHIDGKAEAYKAPSVKFLSHKIQKEGVIGIADIKYAYDWGWAKPWPKVEQNFSAEWEEEKANPVDLGWPKNYKTDWLPSALFGSETGYNWTNGLRRRPYNKVQKYFRGSVAVKGKNPFALVVDDLRKDDSQHLYEWYMQVPLDVELQSTTAGKVILKEAQGERRLLVQDLGRHAQKIEATLQTYIVHEDTKKNKKTMGKRLVLSLKAVEPGFRILLYPFTDGDTLPEIEVEHDGFEEEYEIETSSGEFEIEIDTEDGLEIELD